eukprot:GILI01025688.1.p1 GENE.GILI01025688.1~~GILI01025688.1.p1  ORF type:complete len:272 (-),score=54.05 GILI01025688.1:111-890(-)
MSTGSLSEETQKYIQDKQVEPLMEHLMHELLLALPTDPLGYLEQILETNPTPKIIVTGPPASGKGTQCERICQLTGAIKINTGDLLQNEINKGTEVGKVAADYLSRGALVPDTILVDLLKARLAQKDVKQSGWCLDGFPRTRSQALSLQLAGVIPSIFIVLDIADSISTYRCSVRREDPATGTLYNMLTNPPPSDVDAVVRQEDTPDGIAARLASYHRNFAEVLACYPTARVHLDASQPADKVFDEAKREISAKAVDIG